VRVLVVGVVLEDLLVALDGLVDPPFGVRRQRLVEPLGDPLLGRLVVPAGTQHAERHDHDDPGPHQPPAHLHGEKGATRCPLVVVVPVHL
jgi:hypothetical protein